LNIQKGRGLTSSALLALFDEQVRQRAGLDEEGVATETVPPVTRVYYPHQGFIAAPADTGLRGAELDAVIAREIAAFSARGEAVEWKTYGYDEPADLATRLTAAGFVPEEPETLLIGESAELAGLGTEVEGVSFREAADDDDLAAIGGLHTEVWGEDWSWIAADLRDRIDNVGPDGIRVLLAEDGDRLVSAAWLVMRPDSAFAGLWGGSTLASHRGRGIYRALVARRAAIANDCDIRYLQVDASDMSRPILERLGFVALTTTTPYVWSPDSAK
jgi:GNAT superfamily N-acetyltransferase